jgi:hypothetical protein
LLKNDSVSSTYENEKVDGMKINKEIMTDWIWNEDNDL